jgi:hypothetical protein
MYARVNVPGRFCEQIEDSRLQLPQGVVIKKWESKQYRKRNYNGKKHQKKHKSDDFDFRDDNDSHNYQRNRRYNAYDDYSQYIDREEDITKTIMNTEKRIQ